MSQMFIYKLGKYFQNIHKLQNRKTRFNFIQCTTKIQIIKHIEYFFRCLTNHISRHSGGLNESFKLLRVKLVASKLFFERVVGIFVR